MDKRNRRHFLITGLTAGSVGVAGCLSFFDNDSDSNDTTTDDDSSSEGETNNSESDSGDDNQTQPDPDSDPDSDLVDQLHGDPSTPSEGVAESMAFLPSRETPPRHPELYSGESPFDEPTELVVSAVEDLPDEMAEGEFNEKIAFYEPREYLQFAAEYWTKSFENLTIHTETPRIGEDAHPEADVIISWRTMGDVLDLVENLNSLNGVPVTVKPGDETIKTGIPQVSVNGMAEAEVYKHALITMIGKCLGLEYQSTGIMQRSVTTTPDIASSIEEHHRTEGAQEMEKSLIDQALNARRLLLQEEFEEARTISENAQQEIDTLPEYINPILDELIAENAEYSILALYELVYFFDTDIRSVFEHIDFQVENKDPTYSEIDGGDAPILHAYRHKANDSISASQSILAGVYNSQVNLDLDLRVGIQFDPDNYDYYSSYQDY